MAEYKGIHGTKIQNYTADPDNAITGQVWYNETDQVLKFQYVNTNTAGSWSTGVSMNTARDRIGGAGTQTAALAAGGNPSTDTELYDGSSWTEVNNLNTGRRATSLTGTQTAAILAGGYSTVDAANVETWDGTNWTETTDLNTGRRGGAGSGDSSASILV